MKCRRSSTDARLRERHVPATQPRFARALPGHAPLAVLLSAPAVPVAKIRRRGRRDRVSWASMRRGFSIEMQDRVVALFKLLEIATGARAK
jgi:hypothetical protein